MGSFMRIRTLDKSYEVLLRLSEDRRIRTVTAKEDSHPEKDLFLLTELKQKKDIHAFLPFCQEQKGNRPFDDFVEYFSLNGSLFLVFRYYEGQNIREWLSEYKVPLKERLRLGESLFKRLIFLNPPLYLQYEALNWENLLSDKSGSVCFNYELYEPDRFSDVTKEEIWGRIEAVLTELFLEELSDESCPALEEFIEKTGKGAFASYLNAFQTYGKISREILKADEEQTLRPKSFWFRLWEKIKRLAHYVKYLLAAVLLGVLVWYLVYTVLHPAGAGEGEPVNFENIGTLEIKP